MSEYGKKVAKKMSDYMGNIDSVDKEVYDIQDATEGVQVRGALAAGVSKAHKVSKQSESISDDTKRRQDSVEQQFDDLQQNYTEDSPSDAEIVAARTNTETGDNHTTVGRRMDAEYKQVTAQLGDIVYDRLKFVTYEMFKAPYANDGERIKAAHTFANEHNLPVINTVGEYHIENIRNIPVMTNTDLGFSKFYLDESYNSRDPVFKVSSKKEVVTLSSEERGLLLPQIKKSTKRINGLETYRNHLIVATDGSIPVIRRRSGQLHYLKEFFYINGEGGVEGDIYYNFLEQGSSGITECYAYPVDDEYLTIKGGTFFLSGDNNYNYAKNGFEISRSRVIFENQSISFETEDLASESREGFYITDHIYDLEFRNIKGVSFKNIGQGTYFLRTANAVKVMHKNIQIPYQNGDWGCHSGYHTKDITFEDCRLNRVDSHFFGMNYTIRNSTVGTIRYQGAGKLFVEKTRVDIGDSFLASRGDYASIFDGDIHLKDCELIVSESSGNWQRIIRYDADSGFDYIAQSILARSITIENFKFISEDGNEDKRFIVIERSDNSSYTGGSENRKGLRMPSKIILKNIEVVGRKNGVEIMDMSNMERLESNNKHTFNENNRELVSNAEILIENVKGLELIATDTNLSGERVFLYMSGEHFNYHDFSYVPKIIMRDCDYVTLRTGGSRSNILVEKSIIRVIDAHQQSDGQLRHHGNQKYLNSTFSPFLKDGSFTSGSTRINLFSGSNFFKYIDSCMFETPKILRTNGNVVEVNATWEDLGLSTSTIKFSNTRLSDKVEASEGRKLRFLIPEI